VGVLLDRAVHLDEGVDAVLRQSGRRTGPRHAGVDLGQDRPRPLRGREGDVDRHAQAAHAVLVRRRDLHHGDVDPVLAARDQDGTSDSETGT
jgi:hypothetical protein